MKKEINTFLTTKELNLGIEKYLGDFENKSDLSREKSWNLINESFIKIVNKKEKKEQDKDYLALNISVYLASWGMYRGSTKLLQNFNYKVFYPVVEVILNEKYKVLINIMSIEEIYKNRELISELYDEIYKTLEINFIKVKRESDKDKKINSNKSGVTDTLVTKIIVGAFATTLAYDTYIKSKLKSIGIVFNIEDNKNKQLIESIDGIYKWAKDANFSKYSEFPVMKQIDMLLFNH